MMSELKSKMLMLHAHTSAHTLIHQCDGSLMIDI